MYSRDRGRAAQDPANPWERPGKGEYPLNYAVFELQGGRKMAIGSITVRACELGQSGGNPSLQASAGAFERVVLPLQCKTPSQPGTYDLVAGIVYQGEQVRSVREINILPGSGSPAH